MTEPPPQPLESFTSLSKRLLSSNFKHPRVVSIPAPPALAMSKLPGPCAEVDERPTWRIRRFKLWRENCPSLLLTILDPRRRDHLRRYQTYAVPNSPNAVPRGVRRVPVLPPLVNKRDHSPPNRPLVIPRIPDPRWPGRKVNKAVKKQRWLRLLQYKYALDQEHERRFRKGMRTLLAEVADFEERHLILGPGSSRWQHREELDSNRVEDLIQFFKDIRRDSTNIYTYLTACDNSTAPVSRREEVNQAVKEEKARKEKKEERKTAKKSAEENRRKMEAARRILADQRADKDRAGELDELEATRSGEKVQAFVARKREEARLSLKKVRGSGRERNDRLKTGRQRDVGAGAENREEDRSAETPSAELMRKPTSRHYASKRTRDRPILEESVPSNGPANHHPDQGVLSGRATFTSRGTSREGTEVDLSALRHLLELMTLERRQALSASLHEPPLPWTQRGASSTAMKSLADRNQTATRGGTTDEADRVSFCKNSEEPSRAVDSISSFDSSFPEPATELAYGDLNRDEDTAQVVSSGPDDTSVNHDSDTLTYGLQSSLKDGWDGDTAYLTDMSEADTIHL